MTKSDAMLMKMLMNRNSTSTYLIIGAVVVVIVIVAALMLRNKKPTFTPVPSSDPSSDPSSASASSKAGADGRPERQFKPKAPPKTMPSKTSSSVKKTINKVAKDTGIDKVVDAGKKIAKAVEKGAKAAGTAIDKGAEAAGTAIDKGAKALEKGAEKEGKKVIKNQITGPCHQYHTLGAWYQMKPNKPQNYCGTDSMGSMKCKAECLKQQKKYCAGSGTKYPYKCNHLDRGVPLCKEKKMCVDKDTGKPIPCPCLKLDCNTMDYTAVPGSTTQKCNLAATGGPDCKNNCCAAQWNANGLWPGCKTAAGGSRVQCMADRGCDVNLKTTFGPKLTKETFCAGLDYRVAPSNTSDQKCGGYKKGSGVCKKKCCDTQWNKGKGWIGCKNAPDPVLCMKQRGCSAVAPGRLTKCEAVAKTTKWSVDQNGSSAQKCGGGQKGGSECKSDCCAQNYSFCGKDPLCMKQRGCDLVAMGKMTKCEVVGKNTSNYSVDPNGSSAQKCGSGQKGGSECKSACCAAQKDFCDKGVYIFTTKAKCMSDRGCQ